MQKEFLIIIFFLINLDMLFNFEFTLPEKRGTLEIDLNNNAESFFYRVSKTSNSSNVIKLGNLGFEYFIQLFLKFALSNFYGGFHTHEPFDPTNRGDPNELTFFYLSDENETLEETYSLNIREKRKFSFEFEPNEQTLRKYILDLDDPKNCFQIKKNKNACEEIEVYAKRSGYIILAEILIIARHTPDINEFSINYDNNKMVIQKVK